MRSCPYVLLPKILQEALSDVRCGGCFFAEETVARGMRFVTHREETCHGAFVFFWMVDPGDGILVDVRFQSRGPIIWIALLEVISRFLVGKNYDQAMRITRTLLVRELGGEDRAEFSSLLTAIHACAAQCCDIPLRADYTAPPVEVRDVDHIVEDFFSYTDIEKVRLIEEILDREIRPYIAMDGGGVSLVALQDQKLFISYQGACTSCHASVGATLGYIQETLRRHLHPSLEVIPH